MTEVRIQDDLYEAVNGAWLAQATIPADKPATGGFHKLVEENEKLLIEEFEPMRDGKAEVPAELAEFIKFYHLTSDFATRDALGIAPVKSELNRILALKDFEEFKNGLVSWIEDGLSVPFGIDIAPDLKNTDKNTLWFSSPGTILPDTSYYSEEKKEQREQLKAIISSMTEKLLKIVGHSQEEAQELIRLSFAFDEKVVPFANTSEENNQIENRFIPTTFKDITEKWSTIPVKETLNALTGVEIADDERVAIAEKRWSESFTDVINASNFQEMKAWMYLAQLANYTSILSEEIRQIGGEYGRALSGVAEARPQNKHSFDLASDMYSQVVGLYYGHKYFGEEAKKDVKHMVEKMIEVYKSRLETNDWLTKETREKAIVKLENLGVFIGYPDKLEEIYTKFIVDEDKSLAENVLHFRKLIRLKSWAEYSQPVDRTRWYMPAHQVNAYFSPNNNHIVFPAAILQAPFYSIKQSSSQNYGGIGAVIAHEISHAFDNNGAQFDEKGNMNNWWTEEDFAKFDEKKEAMIKEFDGLETEAGKANGTLTVSENIADVGGVNAALAAAKAEDDADLAAFFINWATIWRMKARTEYQALLLSIDPHSPAKLRANIQPQNFEEFHETFGVKEGDGMYRKPEERVQIW